MTDVLLIIDVQNAILDGTAPQGRMDEVMACFTCVVDRLAGLKISAAAQGVQTLLVQNDGPAGHRLAVESEGWQIVSALKPVGNDIVVHKGSCDSFHDTNLMKQLQRLGATRLIIGGCMSQFCVDTTVRRAVSLGFDVVLVSDGHCTGDAGALLQNQIIAHHNHTLNGFEAGAYTVTVMPADAVVFGKA